MTKRVFLGGTCNDSTWRNHMKVDLFDAGLGWFDPVVDDWNEDAQKNELREREQCDFCLYCITPKMTGYYAIAEVTDASNKRPEKTILVLLRYDNENGLVSYRFDDGQWESLGVIGQLIKRNGGQVFDDLKSAAIWIGKQAKR